MDAAEQELQRKSLLKDLVGDIAGFHHLQFVKDIIIKTKDGEEPAPVEDYDEDIPSFSTLKQQVIADMKKYHAASADPIPQDPTNFKGENWERTSYFGICTTTVLSLFLDVRVPDRNMDHNVVLPVGCQPDINAKRFTEPLNAFPLNARLRCPDVTAVVYKAVAHSTSPSSTSEDSKTSLHRIQPMNVSDPSQSTVYGNEIAENLCVADFDSAYHKLLGGNISDIIEDDAEKSPSICFLVLLCSINIAFNLKEEKGWRVLLKQLGVIVWNENALANLKALDLSGPQVKQCAILAFSAMINVKTGFLTGEGVMLGMKDFLLLQDTTNNFQECRHFALDIISPSTFGGNATFCPKVLKEVSHDLCSTLSSIMSKTGSLADFILQNALDDTNSATASGGADHSTQTTLDDGSTSTLICGSADTEDDYMGKLTTAQERALVLLSDNKRHNPQVQAIFQNFAQNGNTSTGTPMDDSAAALIKALMPKINIPYSPHSNRKAPKEFFWVVGLLTQWKERSSAEALFSVLQSDEKNHLLPSGTNGAEVRFQLYILTWDRIYKARKAVATVVLKEYEVRTGKKTRTGRGKKKTSNGKKALLDKMARKLSPVILNTVKDHGLAVKIPDSWSEACPVLYRQVRGGDKGENLDCLVGVLLDMIVSTHQSASSLKFGTAWQSMDSTAKLLDLDDSKLFAYNGEDMDLAEILSLLLQQDDFSSCLNSILDAKNKERQAGTTTSSSTRKKEKAMKKPNKVAKPQDSSSDDEELSSEDEEDDTATLTKMTQSKKKADAVKKCVGKFIADEADTEGGGHESEDEEPIKWKDLETFFDKEELTKALHEVRIQRDEKIEPKVYEFLQLFGNNTEQAEEMVEKVQLEGEWDGEKLKERITELEKERDGKKKLEEDQKAKIKKHEQEMDDLYHKYNRAKARVIKLEKIVGRSTQRKQISPSSSAGTANKKRTRQSALKDRTNRQTTGSNKKAKPKTSDDSDDEEEYQF